MLNTKNFIKIAGNSEKWDNELRETKNLVQTQVDQSARGFRPAKLVYSMYGWTVRYASGLQDGAILFKSGDYRPEKAVEWVKLWVAEKPDMREAYVSKFDVSKCIEDGYDCSVFGENNG